ncbi:MAG: glycosyltransferase family 39 protein [Pseudomonadota bacterium]|nr:glycosyltransferase family 39 protein [Pseudomonadota bacterium]
MKSPDFFSLISSTGKRYVNTPLRLYLLFFVLSQILYQIGLTSTTMHVFDESHYISAAQVLLDEGRIKITEHPPLGVQIIATGIKLFGDNPFGWRAASALFGSLLIVALMMLCFACGLRPAQVIYIATLSLCSAFIYIHARIAMLDIFMATLIVFAIAVFVTALTAADKSTKILLLVLSAMLWGFAVACKWTAVIGFAATLYYMLMLKIVKSMRLSRYQMHFSYSWHDPRYLANINIISLYTVYLASFFAAYALPYFLVGEFNIVHAVKESWELQHLVPAEHNYYSAAWKWPLMLRPIWYEYVGDSNNKLQAILCLGNPVILLAGLVGLIYSFFSWWKYQSLFSFLCLFFYGAFYGAWFITAREAAYHYYYFVPSLFLLLSLGQQCSLGLGAKRRYIAYGILALAALLFVWYFPVTSGLPLLPKDHNLLRLWAWFVAWI